MHTQGAKKLLAQIIIRSLEDLSRPTQRESAQAFFDSPHLEWVADGLNLSPRRIRRRVAEGVDPKLLRNARRARKGKDGGVVGRRAASL